jgi:hypothetical protein
MAKLGYRRKQQVDKLRKRRCPVAAGGASTPPPMQLNIRIDCLRPRKILLRFSKFSHASFILINFFFLSFTPPLPLLPFFPRRRLGIDKMLQGCFNSCLTPLSHVHSNRCCAVRAYRLYWTRLCNIYIYGCPILVPCHP